MVEAVKEKAARIAANEAVVAEASQTTADNEDAAAEAAHCPSKIVAAKSARSIAEEAIEAENTKFVSVEVAIVKDVSTGAEESTCYTDMIAVKEVANVEDARITTEETATDEADGIAAKESTSFKAVRIAVEEVAVYWS